MKDTCVHLWSGIHISPEGYIHLCGISKEKISGFIAPHIDDIDNLNIFFNSEYFVNMRNTKIQNNKFCKGCITRENSGIKSLRNMLPNRYQKHNISTDTKSHIRTIEHLDVCFNNLCNQQCVMCKSECSSKWFKKDKQLQNSEFIRNPVKYKKWTNDSNMNKILEILPKVKLLTIKGGEPLIQDEVKTVLKYIIENNLQTKIEVLSNFQELSEEMMEILYNLKNFALRISLDATGSMYNWTRGGDWDKTVSNIRKYMNGCKYHTDIAYTNTLNRWSFKSLIEDIKIVEKINSEFCKTHNNYNILLVIGPKYTSPFAAPLQERKDFIYNFEKTYGFIIEDNILYGSLKINHLFNILALENDTLNLSDSLIELSDKWAVTIDDLRNYNK